MHMTSSLIVNKQKWLLLIPFSSRKESFVLHVRNKLLLKCAVEGMVEEMVWDGGYEKCEGCGSGERGRGVARLQAEPRWWGEN